MRYAELHARSNFSFLQGASHPDELVARAAELGYAALAVTDRSSLAGVVRAHTAAKDVGLKLIVGAEITPTDAPPVVLWAADRQAYGRLTRLITVGRRRVEKGQCQLTFDDLAQHVDGLLAGVLVPDKLEALETADAGSAGALPSRAGIQGSSPTGQGPTLTAHGSSPTSPPMPARREPCPPEPALTTARALDRYRELFGDRCYLLAELSCGPDDERRLDTLIRLSRETQIPLVAAGDVSYHVAGRKMLSDVLTAIRHGTTVQRAGRLLSPNAQQYLRPLDEIIARFARLPDAVQRSVEVADRCTFSLDELRYEYPEECAPPGESPLEYLERLTWLGATKRYPGGVPDKVRRLVRHELELIAQLRYEAYFLTVWDLVRFARSQGILCQGRGSAANSAVCYCLGVTAVDPDQMDVLFERFVSHERNEAPDIDVDFEHERREEVLQYIYEKYGRERAGMTAEVISYRPRSAVRDVGKALGLSLDRVDTLAKTLEGYSQEPRLADRCRQSGIDPDSRVGRQLIQLVQQLLGFPRHLSQHVGGMVITRGPLSELVPIENAAMPGRTVIEWDKDDLDELGILKVDCLALGMLTAIRKCFALVKQHTGRRLSLAGIPPDDSDVYDMISRADTMGVFQIESRAQMSMLPRLRPRTFYDLVIEIAIVRPGPIQGNMVHPYLRRRSGQEPVTYPNEEIREVLRKTLGVPLFQEQAMRLAVVAAGFTPGEADQLRRAMGAWRRPGIIDQFKQKLLSGMRARGLSDDFAEHVFSQIRGFGEYGFPESHAASFALLVYVSAWLKHHHPAAFTAALLNSQPMGFYAPAQLVRNVREQGVEVYGVDVNHSAWDCTLREGRPVREGEAPAEPSGAIREGEAPAEPIDATREGDTPAEPNGAIREGEAPAEPIGATREGDTRAYRPPPSVPHMPARQEPPPPGPAFASPRVLCLGLRMIIGLPRTAAARIEGARRAGPFRSLEDFARRTGLRRAVLERLAAADAFRSLDLKRRGALWQVFDMENRADRQPLLNGVCAEEPLPEGLPEMDLQDEVYTDYQTSGLSLRAHPVSFYRTALDALGIVPAARLAGWPNGRPVCVAGLVLVRQRPSTARGITFVTLEDETGTSNLVIRPQVWQRHYRAARTASALVAHGILERKCEVIHVVVSRLEDLTEQLENLTITTPSRDFR